MRILWNSEQVPTPSALEIIRGAADNVWGPGEELEFVFSEPGPGVIQFGTKGDGILSYSMAQIAGASDSLSLLTETFNVYAGNVQLPMVRYEVLDTIAPLAELGENVVVDIETRGPITGQPRDREILCVGIWDGTDKPVYIIPGDLFYAHLVFILEVFSRRSILCHNAKFDLGDLNYHLKGRLRAAGDTMVLHYCMHPAAAHGLKPLARMYLGAPDWDGAISKYVTGTGDAKDYGKVPKAELYLYCAFDVFYTLNLFKRLCDIAKPDSLRFYEQRMIDARFLHDIEEAPGVYIDIPYYEDLDVKMVEEMNGMRLGLQALAGDEKFNPNSPQQVAKVLTARGFDLKGTAKDLLEPHKSDEFIGALLDYRKQSKLHSTYVRGMLERQQNSYVHPSFKECGTITGRLAATNPNIQNIPRKSPIKKGIVAPDGYDIVTADYSQVEARIMAVLSGDTAMQAAFQEDSGDFFDLLMPSFFPEKFASLEAYEAYKDALPGGEDKVYRAKAKGVVYGLAFGREAAAIGDALEMPVQEAAALIRAYARTYPVMWEWREEMKRRALNGELVSLFGFPFERQIITRYNKADIERSALSFMPQHHANQLLLNGLRAMNEDLGDRGWIHALVHDAGYLYVKEEHSEQVGKELVHHMEEAGRAVFADVVVFAAKPKIGKTWEEV